MLVRTSALLLAALVSQTTQPPAAPQAKLTSLLSGDGVATIRLEAPVTELFAKGSEDENVSVPGIVTFKDANGADVVLRDVEVSVRGHTSRRETECPFPKLKLKRKGAGSLKINTHCGESPDNQLTQKYGRLANEKSPYREGLAYRILQAAEVPALHTRPARITYVDPGSNGGTPFARNALLVEDDDDAMKRAGGTTELTFDNFGDVSARHATADAGLVAFGEALIGNFDWHLKFSPDDTYRSTESKPLWNVLAFDRGGSTSLMMMDFDLAGIVVGRHSWFDKVWNRAFVPSKNPIEIEVLSQVQRTRTLLPRADLDTLRRHFLNRRAAVQAAIEKGEVDPAGRDLARAYVDAFYKAIGEDAAFYRPVVARGDVQVYMDAQRTREACAAGDKMRAGTPVNELQKAGAMSQVVILDSMWRWGSKNECDNVQNGPVWIASDAITADFPPKSR